MSDVELSCAYVYWTDTQHQSQWRILGTAGTESEAETESECELCEMAEVCDKAGVCGQSAAFWVHRECQYRVARMGGTEAERSFERRQKFEMEREDKKCCDARIAIWSMARMDFEDREAVEAKRMRWEDRRARSLQIYNKARDDELFKLRRVRQRRG